MKKRMVGILVALGLMAGLLFAMTGIAAANPCQSPIVDSAVIFDEENTQTQCVSIDVEQNASTGDAFAILGSASSGSANNNSSIGVVQAQSQ